MKPLRKDQQLLLIASALSLVLWMTPILRIGVAPLAYLNTHLHELFHALAALATGGRVDNIKVFANFGGVAHVRGGFMPLIASAGYVGTSILGGALIMAGRSAPAARTGLWLLFGFLAFSMVAFVRGDLVGVAFGFLWVGGLWLLASKLDDDMASFAAQFLGIQQCLTSVVAFFALINVSLSWGHSDARLMAEFTGLPDIFWAGVWLTFSVMVMGFCLAQSWRGQGQEKKSGSP